MARRNPLLAKPEVREAYLNLIKAGTGQYAAAHALGLSDGQVTFAKEDPEFRKLLDEALNASTEDVIGMLRKRAIEQGDVAAAKEYLRHQAPPPRGAKSEHLYTHRIELPASLDDVDMLAQRLEMRLADERRAELEERAVDVEEVEGG